MTLPILDLISAEREIQVEQWGGPSHDDRHSMRDWAIFIEKQLEMSVHPTYTVEAAKNFEHRMTKIAALAIAAMESNRRRFAKRHGNT